MVSLATCVPTYLSGVSVSDKLVRLRRMEGASEQANEGREGGEGWKGGG